MNFIDYIINQPTVLRARQTVHEWIERPHLLRHSLRDSPPGQIILCASLGLVVGFITLLLHETVLILHQWLFTLPPHSHLSSGIGINIRRILIIPAAGGATLGIFFLLTRKWKQRDIVDPIEANAVFGGHMSINDSLRLVAATLTSNAAGLSVGMEAAYTQMGAALLSWFGQRLGLRREDLRIMVAAGAAAAIAAAFNAPLAGAFYGFELVLGNYTITALSQVSAAALAGSLFMRFTSTSAIFSLPATSIVIADWQYPMFIILGIAAAMLGIGTMKAVTRCEQIATSRHIPNWLRPALGGVIFSVIAVLFPQVLGSGQGAIDNHLQVHWSFIALLGLLCAKVASSALSIGMGFRGGLFSSSLFLGCIFGQIVGTIIGFVIPDTHGQLVSFMLVGMGSVGASIIGAPVTMILLVLEMTGNFSATTGVLVGVLVSSAITRYSFGYSFSTWRFHLRGLRIFGAYDIGWIHDLTASKLMLTDAKTVLSDQSLATIRQLFAPGSTKYIFVIDEQGHYQGIIYNAALHSTELDKQTEQLSAIDIAKGKDQFLLPEQNIQSALKTFTDSELEALPILLAEDNHHIIGYLTESYALRHYTQELEHYHTVNYGAVIPPDQKI